MNLQTEQAETPNISVLIPVYNCEAYISRCIESIFAQTVPDIEIIIVDDASTDASFSLIGDLERARPASVSMTVIRQENTCGVSAARNRALQSARGEFLFFIDGDDWISPVCLDRLFHEAIKHDADVCSGSFEYVYELEEVGVKQPPSIPPQVYVSNEEVLAAHCDRLLPTFIWNKLVRKSLFDENGLMFEPSIDGDEDQLWSFRLSMLSCRWVSIDAVTYYYRKDNTESITAMSTTHKRLSNLYDILGYMWEDVESLDSCSSRKKALIAKAIYNFTKSILWHVELEADTDIKELYNKFRNQNVITTKSWVSRSLGLRDRCFALGWLLPYPVNRGFNPSFIAKKIKKLSAARAL